MRYINKNNFFLITYRLHSYMNRTYCKLCKHFGSCFLVCSSCVWFCLHTVESAFGFVLECVITADYGILYCTERVNEGKKKGEGARRMGWQERKWTYFLLPPCSPQMNLLDDMLFGEPCPPLFAFLSSPWLEWLCGYQDQSLSFFFAVAFIRSHCVHTSSSSCLLAKQIHGL